MRTVIISCTLVFVLIITSIVLFTIYGQNTRQNELDDTLNVVVEQALDNLKISKIYSIDNKDEFCADLVQNIALYIESDSEVRVDILAVDVEKGLLDVNVTSTFKQPNGSMNSASCRKTVIMEEYTADTLDYYLVQFMTTKESNDDFVEYKTFSICEGDYAIVPSVSPKKEGYTFKGWSYTKPDASNAYSPETVNASDIEGELAVVENIVFYAVFEEN